MKNEWRAVPEDFPPRLIENSRSSKHAGAGGAVECHGLALNPRGEGEFIAY
ncbi:hypothetical protein [Paenibacillus sp. SAFN-117]|uniref:hypothetical protein n=1 Tax=Paenibacillus sp. SAFN-117 TaxID=3436860 RepID=UPI003F81005A